MVETVAQSLARIREEQRQANLKKYSSREAIPISQAPKTFKEAIEQENTRRRSRSSSSTNYDVFTGQLPQSVLIPESEKVSVVGRGTNVIGVKDPITQQSYLLDSSEKEIRELEQTRAARIVQATQPTTKKTKAGEYDPAGIGSINVATETEKKAMTPVGKIKGAFLEGYRQGGLFGKREYDVIGRSTYGGTRQTAEEKLLGGFTALGAAGAYVGDIFTISGGGSTTMGLKTPAAVTKGKTALATNLAKLTKTPVPALTTNIVGGTAVGLGTAAVVTEGVKARRNVGLDVGRMDKTDKEVFNIARQAERKAQEGIVRSVGFEIGVAGNENVFLDTAAAELQKRGVKDAGARLQRLQEERIARQAGTLSGTLAAGAFSETTGSIAVRQNLAAGAKPTFFNFAKNIFPAGAGEGFSQTVISQTNVGDVRGLFEGTPRTFQFPVPQAAVDKNQALKDLGFTVKTSRAGEAGLGALFGGTTAGVLGGAIGSLAAKGSKARRGFLETVGYIIDPTEKPSDILSDIVGVTGRQPVVSIPTAVPAFTSVTTTTPTQTPAQAKKTKTRGFTNVDTFINNIVSTQSSTFTTVPTPVEETVFSMQFSPVPAETPSFTPVPADTPVPVDVPTDIPVPADVPTNVPVDIFVDVPANVPVNVPVAVPTNKVGAVPPLFPFLSFGSGGYAGRGRKQRVKFVDELTAGTAIFKNLLGFGGQAPKQRLTPPTAVKKSSKKKIKATTKKTAKKARSVPRRAGGLPNFNDFNKRVFG